MVTHKIVNGNYKIVNGNYRIVNGKIVNGTARPPKNLLTGKNKKRQIYKFVKTR